MCVSVMVVPVLTESRHRRRDCLGKGGRNYGPLVELVAEDLTGSAPGLQRITAPRAGGKVCRIGSGEPQPAVSARDVGHDLCPSDGGAWCAFIACSFGAVRVRTAGTLGP
jgi:hypothetical protein